MANVASAECKDVPDFPRHVPRAGWTSARLWVLGGLLFLLAMAGVEHLMREATGLATDADWPARISCGVAAAIFLFVVPGGVLDRIRRRRTDASRKRHPGEPWLFDRRWDPRGETRTPLARLPRTLIFWTAYWVLSPLFNTTYQRVPLLWLIPGLAVTWLAWALWKVFGAGTTHVRFASFPYRTGERVTVHFGSAPGGARFETVAWSLRYLVEEAGAMLPASHVVYPMIELDPVPADGLLPGPDQDVVVSFDVPADAGGTRLADALPRWWSLDVAGMTSAGPYAESFLVPIYEKPRGDETAAT